MHRFRSVTVLVGIAALACGLAAAPTAARAQTRPVTVAIVTNLGTIDVVLDPLDAPITTKNFLRLVDKKFYDGGSFFRAVPSFVIQGGNKTRESDHDPTIKLESPLKTGVRNVDGAISMARTPDPDSATSEFFIDDGDQARLDGGPGEPGYAAFGHVTKNMELVRKISHMPAQGQALLEPVKIISIHRI